jgi:hypothetical protein
MSAVAWTPVNESAWTPVPEENPEAVAAANPPHATFAIPVPVTTMGPARAAGNYQADPNEAPRTPTQNAIMKGLIAAPVAMSAPELLPEMGLLGTAAASGIGAAGGTSLGQAMTGQNPLEKKNLIESGEAGATAGVGSLVLGGLAAGAKNILKSGIFGDGLSSWFAEGPNGTFVPTDDAKAVQRIHEAIGVKPGDMNIGLGATTAEDAYNLPGRAIVKAGIKPADLEGLTPFEQAEKLKPIWNKAGEAVAATADKATKAGIKFDGAKSLTQAIGDMLDPEGSKALKLANDTAKQIGIKNWAKMTPNEAVELKQALWQRLPGRFKGPVYGALSRDLNKAVPEMIPVNRDYTEMRSAMDAIQGKAEQFMSRAGPSKFDQLLESLRQHPALGGLKVAGALGTAYQGYEGAKTVYDLMKGK